MKLKLKKIKKDELKKKKKIYEMKIKKKLKIKKIIAFQFYLINI